MSEFDSDTVPEFVRGREVSEKEGYEALLSWGTCHKYPGSAPPWFARYQQQLPTLLQHCRPLFLPTTNGVYLPTVEKWMWRFLMDIAAFAKEQVYETMRASLRELGLTKQAADQIAWLAEKEGVADPGVAYSAAFLAPNGRITKRLTPKVRVALAANLGLKHPKIADLESRVEYCRAELAKATSALEVERKAPELDRVLIVGGHTSTIEGNPDLMADLCGFQIKRSLIVGHPDAYCFDSKCRTHSLAKSD